MVSKIVDTSCNMAGGPHWNTKLDLMSGQTCTSLNTVSPELEHMLSTMATPQLHCNDNYSAAYR